MVHDIKNNEGGIMNKIKKLKVKAPPSVPRRDYAPVPEANGFPNPLSQGGECVDLGDADLQKAEDRNGQSPLEDSDYENPDEHSDSEMYVLPAEEAGDDSYEPPPAEQETRTVHPALPFARGEYVEPASSLYQQHSGQSHFIQLIFIPGNKCQHTNLKHHGEVAFFPTEIETPDL
ncbi:hypothetical protein K5549_012485 [Capra hircus]|nr:hypothetical protein K5549_012485 [Capra hircus]